MGFGKQHAFGEEGDLPRDSLCSIFFFIKFIYYYLLSRLLFIFGCVGSSFLCEGFL